MPKHKILFIPNPKLRQETQLISENDADLQILIDEMFETMYDADGVGLAATQIGIPLRVAVMDVSRSRNEPIVMINPKVVDTRDPIVMQEGCLSVPGHWDKLTRPNYARVECLDRDGKPQVLEGEGLLAECMQHEIDHLHGKLYIDYLSKIKQKLILQKVHRYCKKNSLV